ncbi:glucose-6-phosphate 1-dehydrogenase [Marinitoga hydrogenitolerans DSM 16785]|uniref:Glucose-6-phosphate 1-dehydrogenase n=1 Tax=Marinitoga hydrogenitolerans (strain DSM 16785 / JCM 12826 / AT1271) TaxID=1122195 RepID=A0A1M4S5H7_MARH1|nr:glucose-6-phosphate dehydrogenase [Marinitoga hydrogenitolerans]SHE27267.1 glucose-6-phosphate 1-dehydrogenase [Marinitoga hydrogenitolerans DSM 16785]
MSFVENKLGTYVELCDDPTPSPAGIIIFGASGDLSFRKLIPSIFKLFKNRKLINFYLLGIGRTKMSNEEFRHKILESLNNSYDKILINKFINHAYFLSGNYNDDSLYSELKNRIKSLNEKHNTNNNLLFYFATPPHIYLPIINHLGKSNLTIENKNYSRVIIEKPFGKDLETAKELDNELQKHLKESQIYRIDHYLGKETVQNMMMMRFANIVFEPIWNYKYIDHIQITVSETLGVENRIGYFENTGLLRDMFQNHILQLLTLIAMEPPASLDSDMIHDEKIKVLKSIRPYNVKEIHKRIIRGQYTEGYVDGDFKTSYIDEVGKKSKIETFIATKLYIDNWRWSGVPFYLRTGKRLKKKISEVAIIFKDVPHSIFSDFHPVKIEPNSLVIRIQPDEGFTLTLQAKQPGSKICINTLNMEFKYKNFFDFEPQDAYERLILDALLGDQTLYVRNDVMEESWKLVTPILEYWKNSDDLFYYPSGSWGPKEAFELIEKDNRNWRNL